MIALFINITLNAKLLSLHNLKYVSLKNENQKHHIVFNIILDGKQLVCH